MSAIETRTAGSTTPASGNPIAAEAPRSTLPPAPVPTRAPLADPRAARSIKAQANPVPVLVTPRDDASKACVRKPTPDNGPRRMVISHPFDATGERSSAFEVLDVSPTGTISRPGRTFNLSSAFTGNIAFTPDGQVGLIALDNGKIGVFRLDNQGNPTVVHEGFAGKFYASKVVVDPHGDSALIVDANSREHGGGVYQVGIGCDGSLTDRGLVLPAQNPGAIAFSGDKAVVAAVGVGEKREDPRPGETVPDTVHLMQWGQTPSKIAGTDAFGNDQEVFGGAALADDGKTFLIGDTNGFGNFPNQVGVVDVRENGISSVAKVEVPNPDSIAVSPFGKVAIVASPLTDAIYVMDANGPKGSWRVRGEVPYRGGRPQLPGNIATIERGDLRGHVFVSENVSVRHLAFRKDGSVVDLGSFPLGKDMQSVGGAIGVTK